MSKSQLEKQASFDNPMLQPDADDIEDFDAALSSTGDLSGNMMYRDVSGNAPTMEPGGVVTEDEATTADVASNDSSPPSSIWKPMKSMHLANVFAISVQRDSKPMGQKVLKLVACVALLLLQLVSIGGVFLGVTMPNCGHHRHCPASSF